MFNRVFDIGPPVPAISSREERSNSYAESSFSAAIPALNAKDIGVIATHAYGGGVSNYLPRLTWDFQAVSTETGISEPRATSAQPIICRIPDSNDDLSGAWNNLHPGASNVGVVDRRR